MLIKKLSGFRGNSIFFSQYYPKLKSGYIDKLEKKVKTVILIKRLKF